MTYTSPICVAIWKKVSRIFALRCKAILRHAERQCAARISRCTASCPLLMPCVPSIRDAIVLPSRGSATRRARFRVQIMSAIKTKISGTSHKGVRSQETHWARPASNTSTGELHSWQYGPAVPPDHPAGAICVAVCGIWRYALFQLRSDPVISPSPPAWLHLQTPSFLL